MGVYGLWLFRKSLDECSKRGAGSKCTSFHIQLIAGEHFFFIYSVSEYRYRGKELQRKLETLESSICVLSFRSVKIDCYKMSSSIVRYLFSLFFSRQNAVTRGLRTNIMQLSLKTLIQFFEIFPNKTCSP